MTVMNASTDEQVDLDARSDEDFIVETSPAAG